jgi:restriction system protein
MISTHAQRNGELLRALFKIISTSPDGMPAGQALAILREAMTLKDNEQGTYKSGAPKFEKIVRFATLGPKRAGWLLKNEGTWTITQEGLDAYANFPDPMSFHREIHRLYHLNAPTASEESSVADDEGSDNNSQSSEDISVSLDEALSNAKAQIREYLMKMGPYDFQDLIAGLLRAMGYHVDWVARQGPDGGIDIVAYPDDLGITSPKVKVQVKREARETTEGGLREFLSFIGEDEVGIFVSTGGFNAPAKKKAREERRKLTLIAADRLIELWIKYYNNLIDKDREYMPLKPVWYLRNSAEK